MIDGLQNMLQRRSLSSSNILAPPTKHRRSSSLPGLRHGDEVADQVSAKDLQLTVGMSEWSLKPPSVSNLTSEGRAMVMGTQEVLMVMVIKPIIVVHM